jgi:hypothetical protein
MELSDVGVYDVIVSVHLRESLEDERHPTYTVSGRSGNQDGHEKRTEAYSSFCLGDVSLAASIRTRCFANPFTLTRHVHKQHLQYLPAGQVRAGGGDISTSPPADRDSSG